MLRATVRSAPDEPVTYALDLVELRDGRVTRLLEGPDEILDVALTDDTLVWSSKDGAGAVTINQRPRAGAGTVTSYPETDPHAGVADLVAGRAGVGYLVTDPDDPDDPDDPSGTALRVVLGSTARTIALPLGGSGLAAVGDRFLTATGGDETVAGVYSVTLAGGGTVTRTATVPSATLPAEQWSLSAGTFRYSDRAEPLSPGRPVWERTLTDQRPPRFSAERRLPQTAGPIAFSAGRGVVADPRRPNVWHLLDRGGETGEIEASGVPNVSGPYTLIGGRVHRPDGERIWTAPAGEGQDDLFGSAVVHVRPEAAGDASETGDVKVWLADAEKPSEPPTELATIPAWADCGATQVSIWGELVAWAPGCGQEITVRDLRTGTTRVVPTDVPQVRRLILSEGTLTWTTSQDRVLDLTSPTSVPVTLPSLSRLVAVDDHLIARDLRFRFPGDVSPDPQVALLPFTPEHAPRLIARLAPLGFSPNGDGRADRWTPQFDVTKPLRSATLKITDHTGRTTVRTIEGTAPDGSLRGLSWDGLSSRGAQLPAGTYRWTLTGRARDGEGALIDTNGGPTAGGTVEINLP